MAFGPEVGSVSVRVIPDTRKFRIEANKQLKALRKDLTELKAKIVPDLDKAFAKQAKQIEKKPVKASVKADLDNFQKQALAELKKTALKLDAKIPLTPDGERLRKSAAAAMKDLEGRIKAKVPLDVNVAANARQSIRQDLAYLKSQIKSETLEVQVDSNVDRAKTQIGALLRDIPKIAESGNNRIHLKIDGRKAKEDLRAAIALLQAEAAAADIQVSMSVDAAPAAALGASGAMLSRIATLGAGLAGLLVLTLGPALSLVTGLLAAMPGLLAGVAIPMGAVALMTTDLAKAFEKVTGPIAELGPPLIELQNSVKGSFFAGFTGELNGTANGITILKDAIGQLSGPLNNLTGALGEALTGAIQGLLTGGGMEALKTLITNIGDGFRTAAPAIGQLVASLAKMAAAMTGKGMVEAFTKLANSFSEWVGKDENIKKVQEALTGLLDVITSMGPELGNILRDSLKTMGDPNFVKNVKEIVTGLLELVKVIAWVGNAMASVKDLFSIDNLIGNFVPGLGGMTTAFSAAIDTIKSLWTGFGSFISTVLVNSFTGLGAALSGIWTGIVTAMQGAWDTVITLITAKFQQLPQSIQNVIGGIVGVFGSLVSSVANVVGQIPGVVAGIFGQIASVIAGAVGSFVAAAASGFGQLVSTIVSAMGQALAAVVSGTGNIVSEAATLGGRVVSAVSGFAGQMAAAGRDLILGLARGIAGAASAALDAARNIASSVIGAVRGVFKSRSPSRVMMGVGNDVVDGLTIGIGQKQHLASDRAAGMAQNVVDGARKVIADGIDPLMVDVQIDPEALEKLKKEKDLLDLQAKTLGVQKDQAPDKMAKAALQAQLDQINARKREIALIQEQANYQKKYGSDVEDTASKYSDLLGAAQDIPTNFAKANINQFTKDLGMSGQGAIPDLISQGANYVFQVLDLESAISGMTRVQSKNALAQR